MVFCSLRFFKTAFEGIAACSLTGCVQVWPWSRKSGHFVWKADWRICDVNYANPKHSSSGILELYPGISEYRSILEILCLSLLILLCNPVYLFFSELCHCYWTYLHRVSDTGLWYHQKSKWVLSCFCNLLTLLLCELISGKSRRFNWIRDGSG